VLRFAFLATVALIGCGRPHDLGVSTASSTSSGAGGASAATSSTAAGTGGALASGSGGMDAGPSGPTTLTIVDGIDDYSAARFCFLPGETPWPAAASGLPFATGQTVDLASAVPAGTDVTVWVVAGNLAVTAGSTCTQILALAQPSGSADGGTGDGGAAPLIVAAELGVIPQAVFASDQSLLLVPTGCMGGAGHDDPKAAAACGTGYTSTTPTTGVVLLSMSRITDAHHVSLQVVNASSVLPTGDVGVEPNLMPPMQVIIAPSLGPGAIGPSPPFAGLSLSAFGPLSGVQINTYPSGSTTPTSSTTLGPVLSASTVGTAGFIDGAGLALVAVGSAPGLAAGPFWHPLTYALVNASPQ
jgi:hypothetical protein